jgi:hypothetical protein
MIHTTKGFLWRVGRITCGFVLLLLGLVLSIPFVPGPGVVLLVLGFGMLSRDFVWANKVYMRCQQWGQEIFKRSQKKTTTEDNHERQGPSRQQTPG